MLKLELVLIVKETKLSLTSPDLSRVLTHNLVYYVSVVTILRKTFISLISAEWHFLGDPISE